MIVRGKVTTTWQTKIVCAFLIASFVGVAHCGLIDQPAYRPYEIKSDKTMEASLNEKQVRKIVTENDGAGVFSMNLTLVSGKEFCYSVNRKINYQEIDSYALYPISVSDVLGLTSIQNPVIIAQSYLKKLDGLLNVNLVSFDSNGIIKLFVTNPIYARSDLIASIDITKEEFYQFSMDTLLMNSVYIQQQGPVIYIATSDSTNAVNLYKVQYNAIDEKWGVTQEQNNMIIGTSGEFTDFISTYDYSKDEGVLFLVFEQKVSLLLTFSGLVQFNSSLQDMESDGLIHQYVYIRLFQPDAKTLSIYLLCATYGIYKYDLDITDQGYTNNPKKDQSFFIKVQYGLVFNQYRGRVFLVTTTDDPYSTYEYEILLTNPSNYYLNRVHSTDHKVREIYMFMYHAMLAGRNTHTMTWHSVHPKVIPNMVEQMNYFQIYSLNGAAFDNFFNDATNTTETYMIALQNRHILILKEVHIAPYIVCSPSQYMASSGDDDESEESEDTSGIIGTNQFVLTLIEKNQISANSFTTIQQMQTVNITVNRVYADKMTAAAIAGIVIGCVVAVSIVIAVIVLKIKRQGLRKSQLQEEIHKSQTRKTSQQFTPVRNQSSNNEISIQKEQKQVDPQVQKAAPNNQHDRNRSDSESGDNNMIINYAEDGEDDDE